MASISEMIELARAQQQPSTIDRIGTTIGNVLQGYTTGQDQAKKALENKFDRMVKLADIQMKLSQMDVDKDKINFNRQLMGVFGLTPPALDDTDKDASAAAALGNIEKPTTEAKGVSREERLSRLAKLADLPVETLEMGYDMRDGFGFKTSFGKVVDIGKKAKLELEKENLRKRNEKLQAEIDNVRGKTKALEKRAKKIGTINGMTVSDLQKVRKASVEAWRGAQMKKAMMESERGGVPYDPEMFKDALPTNEELDPFYRYQLESWTGDEEKADELMRGEMDGQLNPAALDIPGYQKGRTK